MNSDSSPNRPNILWLFCEDVCPWFGCYGDHTIPTPNIDALAASGALFKRCFSPAPVCSPARSGIITGCMPTSIGAHHHQSGRHPNFPQPLPEGVSTLPEIFRDAGYYTYNNGKDDYNFTYDRKDLYAGAYEIVKIYGAHGDGDWKDRAPGQPFFGQITLWGGKNKNLPEHPVTVDNVTVPPYYPDIAEFQNHYVRHYNQLQVTDTEVGAIIQRLKDEGLYDNTIIFFFSDHGYCLLRHKQFLYDGGIHVPLIISGPGVNPGVVREDMVSGIDVAATSLAMAGLEIPASMESENVFAPDFHREAVVSVRDRCDFTVDRMRSVRDERFKYIRNFMTDRPWMQPQYRENTPDFKAWVALHQAGELTPEQSRFVGADRPAEELYDIDADPHETRNLADDPAYRADLERLRAFLDRWIEETNDLGQYPEPPEQHYSMLEHWGDRCADPVFDAAKDVFGWKAGIGCKEHGEVAVGQQ